MIRKVCLVLGMALTSGASAWAIPQTLNFQGFLKESGSSVNGTRDMTFKIYDVQSGGSALYTDSDHAAANGHAVIVSTGIFNVLIGEYASGGASLSGVFDGGDRYIEVTVGAGSPMPRQKLSSVGYAIFAATAATLSQNASIRISSAIFTATGPNQYSLQTSSGINVLAGGVTAPFFAGNGAGLTGLSGTDSSKVAKTGDTMTGALTMSGASANIVSGSSVTASAFFGNGSALTGVLGSDSTRVAKTGDTMTGTLTMSGTSANIVVGASVTASGFFGTGANITGLNASSLGSGTVPLARLSGITNTELAAGAAIVDTKLANITSAGKVADSALPSSMGAKTFTGLVTANAGVTLGANQVLNLSGASGRIVSQSSVTASAFFGNGSGLTGVSGSDSTKVAKTGDTMTGALTMSGASANIVVGASVTASGLFGSGSNITGLNASSLGSGTVPLARLSGITNTELAAGAAIVDTKLANITSAGKVADSALPSSMGAKTFTGLVTASAGVTLGANQALNLSGASGNIVTQSSVTASAFFGNGSGITKLAGSNVVGNITGNAAAASALVSNGTNCSGGQAAMGVDASGNAEGCFAVGSGDATQSGTNIFTGSGNFWHGVSSGTGSSATSVSFALASGVTYDIDMSFFQNTSGGIFEVQFNNDTGANYNYSNVNDRTLSGADFMQATGAAYCRIGGGNGTTANTYQTMHIRVETVYNDTTKVHMFGNHVWDDAGAPGSGGAFSCYYTGAAALTSIKFLTSAGSFNYRTKIYRSDW